MKNNTGIYNNKRFALSIFWILLGAALCILTFTGVLPSIFYSGIGFGILIAGIVLVIRHIRYRVDTDYKKKIDIDYEDERNHFIRMKAWSWAGYYSFMILVLITIGVLIAGREDIVQIISYITAGQLIIYAISYFLIKRKY